MQDPQEIELSPENLEFLNGLQLTPEVEEALLEQWPLLEEMLDQKLTLQEAYEIAFDQETTE